MPREPRTAISGLRNISVTGEGRVKILDSEKAKRAAPAEAATLIRSNVPSSRPQITGALASCGIGIVCRCLQTNSDDKIDQVPMTLFAGQKLGPHAALAPIDAGGLGEVHRARDGRLGSWNSDARSLTSFCEGWLAAPVVLDLDPRTGRVQTLPADKTGISMAWLRDGLMVALRIGKRSRSWRFAPEREQAR